MLACEILSLQLNVRTADDRLALTDDANRSTTVEVGQIFHLEIGYGDLRTSAASGGHSVGVDIDGTSDCR